MSRFEINLNQEANENPVQPVNSPSSAQPEMPKKKSRVKKILGILAVLFGAIFLIVLIGGFFYWQSVKSSPEYSLALLVDAARREDQQEIEKIVDVDAVVDDFVPQITDKAVELYGRGVAPSVINKLAVAISPYLPAVKKRAKLEIPGLIRDKTQKFENVPFWVIALGARRVLEINETGDTAEVKYDSAQRPFEVTMKKNADRWQVVAIRDEIIARRIAEKIGQEVITSAKNGNIDKAGRQIGIQNLKDILNDSDIFK